MNVVGEVMMWGNRKLGTKCYASAGGFSFSEICGLEESEGKEGLWVVS